VFAEDAMVPVVQAMEWVGGKEPIGVIGFKTTGGYLVRSDKARAPCE
jgi:hypothetical protein